MTLHPATAWLVLDRSAGNLEQQIHHGIRDRILDGRLKTNDRLPSSRALAISLQVARSTVAGAYERLRTEGFIDAGRRLAACAPGRAGRLSAAFAQANARAGEVPAVPPRPSRFGQLPASPLGALPGGARASSAPA